MAESKNVAGLDSLTLARVRTMLPDMTDPISVREIVRRYMYLHNEAKSGEEVECLLAYWRAQSSSGGSSVKQQ